MITGAKWWNFRRPEDQNTEIPEGQLPEDQTTQKRKQKKKQKTISLEDQMTRELENGQMSRN